MLIQNPLCLYLYVEALDDKYEGYEQVVSVSRSWIVTQGKYGNTKVFYNSTGEETTMNGRRLDPCHRIIESDLTELHDYVLEYRSEEWPTKQRKL